MKYLKKLMRKCRKNDFKVGVCKMKTKNIFCNFFKGLLNLRVNVLQSELNKVSISNFIRFQFPPISFKIKRAFEKITTFSIKIGQKRTIIRQL